MLLQLIFTVLFNEVFIQSCELSRFDFIFKALKTQGTHQTGIYPKSLSIISSNQAQTLSKQPGHI